MGQGMQGGEADFLGGGGDFFWGGWGAHPPTVLTAWAESTDGQRSPPCARHTYHAALQQARCDALGTATPVECPGWGGNGGTGGVSGARACVGLVPLQRGGKSERPCGGQAHFSRTWSRPVARP